MAVADLDHPAVEGSTIGCSLPCDVVPPICPANLSMPPLYNGSRAPPCQGQPDDRNDSRPKRPHQHRPAEVAKFQAMAAEWWIRRASSSRCMLNPTRLDYVTAQIAAQFGRDLTGACRFRGCRILDIGCGGGLMAEPMARLGASVTGADAARAISPSPPSCRRTGAGHRLSHHHAGRWCRGAAASTW